MRLLELLVEPPPRACALAGLGASPITSLVQLAQLQVSTRLPSHFSPCPSLTRDQCLCREYFLAGVMSVAYSVFPGASSPPWGRFSRRPTQCPCLLSPVTFFFLAGLTFHQKSRNPLPNEVFFWFLIPKFFCVYVCVFSYCERSWFFLPPIFDS